MGRRGPAPTPTKTLKLRGAWRGNVRTQEPEIVGEFPPPAASMEGAALSHWSRLVALLVPAGVLTPDNADALRVYCEAIAAFDESVAVLAMEGRRIKTEDGVIAHPAIKDQQIAADRILRFAQEFGLTPAARSRVAAKRAPESGKSRFFGSG